MSTLTSNKGDKISNIIEISDFSSPNLDVFARLMEKQLRNRLEPEMGIFIAEKYQGNWTCPDAGCEPISLLMERKHTLEGRHKV